ncbi:MAG: hypothetical protein R3Y07_05180 [Eubacteriales bacterium]
MDILKEAMSQVGGGLSPSDLECIHAQSRKKLAEEEIYPFSVRLCDNQIDRDGDRFPKKTLEELAPLFVGKSGIFDHSWTAKGQAARIYRTEVVEESAVDGKGFGEGDYYLKAYAYMVRTESNADLISEIDAGIKKEVSVGCSVARVVCSICGEEMARCPHQKGEHYEDHLCFASLEGATDAYEFSFVAVPAQASAGVIKHKRGMDVGQGSKSLEELVAEQPHLVQELKTLKKQAEVGRNYLIEMQKEVVRLGCLAEKSLDHETMVGVAKKLDIEELGALSTIFSKQVGERLPVSTQFEYGSSEGSVSYGAFQI